MRLSHKADAAYLAMRQAIMEQALTPGTKLPEDRLAEQFAISRTLVRAALSRLGAEGLVEVGNKRTATVAYPSLEEARAVFEVRRCLEAEVVRLVCAHWQDSWRAPLTAHVKREQAAAKAGQGQVSIRLAGEFHILLAERAGNPVLSRYLSEVTTRCSLILAVYGRPHSSDCAITEHLGLIEALARRDAATATRLMAHHLEGIEQRALISRIGAGEQDLGAILAPYVDAAGGTAAGSPA
jgi:DNA-binding GntR family transcriptional regulator